MIRVCSFCFVASAMLACSPAASRSPEAVTRAFTRFATASTPNNGAELTKLVTKGSLEYFEETRDLALYAGPDELDEASIERLTFILLFRTLPTLDPEELRAMSAEEVVAYVLDNKLLETRVQPGDRLAELSIEDGVARAKVVASEKDVHVSVAQMRWERGDWRYDLLPHVELMGKNLLDIADEKGLPPGQYVVALVEVRAFGAKIVSDTFQPLFPKP